MSLEEVSQFLFNVKERSLAEQVLDVFGKHANSFDQFDDISKNFFKIKNYDKAIYYGEKAYAIASTPQQMYIIRHNLINVYNHNNEPQKALRYIKANEHVMEHDIDRDFEKAFSLFLSNRKQEAAIILRDKLKDESLTEEQRIKTQFNLGTYDLLDGNFQKGLRGFLFSGEEMGLWDKSITTFMNQDTNSYGLTRWNGIIKPGINLLITADAGIGDEIINVRFMKKFQEYGMNCKWLTLKNRKDLLPIYELNNIEAYSDIKDISKDFINNCVYVPAMQLPIFLDCKYEDLWDGPYLNNIPETINNKWNTRINTLGKTLKIGIRWQGNPEYDQDLHRSIPLKEIVNAIDIANSTLISVQRDTGLEELEEFPDILDLSDELKTLPDLFACLNNLDLVITSCTSVAHIAASMGKQVVVIVPISCYYIWCNPTENTPWYGDNVKVFYQEKPRSWKEPIAKLKQWLSQYSF